MKIFSNISRMPNHVFLLLQPKQNEKAKGVFTLSSGRKGFPRPPTPPDILKPSSGFFSTLTRIWNTPADTPASASGRELQSNSDSSPWIHSSLLGAHLLLHCVLWAARSRRRGRLGDFEHQVVNELLPGRVTGHGRLVHLRAAGWTQLTVHWRHLGNRRQREYTHIHVVKKRPPRCRWDLLFCGPACSSAGREEQTRRPERDQGSQVSHRALMAQTGKFCEIGDKSDTVGNGIHIRQRQQGGRHDRSQRKPGELSCCYSVHQLAAGA